MFKCIKKSLFSLLLSFFLYFIFLGNMIVSFKEISTISKRKLFVRIMNHNQLLCTNFMQIVMQCRQIRSLLSSYRNVLYYIAGTVWSQQCKNSCLWIVVYTVLYIWALVTANKNKRWPRVRTQNKEKYLFLSSAAKA